jgi:hypothetical protein
MFIYTCFFLEWPILWPPRIDLSSWDILYRCRNIQLWWTGPGSMSVRCG